MIFDLVIKNGIIIDGSGAPAYRADIGIVEDYIAYIGTIENNGNSHFNSPKHIKYQYNK